MTAQRWGWAFGWACLIELLVLWPSPPTLSAQWLPVGADKLVHAVLFAVQAALTARALRAEGRSLWPAAVGTALFGLVTEFQQHLSPSRSFELGDWLADVAGAVIGIAMFVLMAPQRREFHG